MLAIFYIWCFLSYFAALAMIIYEVPSLIKKQDVNLWMIMAFALVFAPFIAWHGVYHYARMYVRKCKGLEVNYWEDDR
jgi:hypothetical protein